MVQLREWKGKDHKAKTTNLMAKDAPGLLSHRHSLLLETASLRDHQGESLCEVRPFVGSVGVGAGGDSWVGRVGPQGKAQFIRPRSQLHQVRE